MCTLTQANEMKTYFGPEDYVGCWSTVVHWYGKNHKLYIHDDYTYFNSYRGKGADWMWSPDLIGLSTIDQYPDWHLVRGYTNEGAD